MKNILLKKQYSGTLPKVILWNLFRKNTYCISLVICQLNYAKHFKFKLSLR